MTWINGRKLSTYNDSAKNLDICYKYNDDGVRTSKKINGLETQYYLEGNKVIFEKIGNDVIYYKYDIDCTVFGFNFKDRDYFYVRNLQDDIIGILDNNYNQIVSYKYDSWGNLVDIVDVSNNNIGEINPFRYRSYYYDSETKLYYLNSRYYIPEWSRFLNADGIMNANQDTLSYNLYVYCGNNPISGMDSNGYFFKKIVNVIKKVVTKVVQTVVNVAKTVVNIAKTGPTVLKAAEYTVQNAAIKVANSIKSNLVFGVGNGPGYGGKIDVLGIGFGAANYINDNITVKNGVATCSITEVKDVKIGIVGRTTEIYNVVPCNGQTITESIPTEYNTSHSLLFMEFGKSSTFIGFQFDIHAGTGGHIKIGWDAPPVIPEKRKSMPASRQYYNRNMF